MNWLKKLLLKNKKEDIDDEKSDEKLVSKYLEIADKIFDCKNDERSVSQEELNFFLTFSPGASVNTDDDEKRPLKLSSKLVKRIQQFKLEYCSRSNLPFFEEREVNVEVKYFTFQDIRLIMFRATIRRIYGQNDSDDDYYKRLMRNMIADSSDENCQRWSSVLTKIYLNGGGMCFNFVLVFTLCFSPEDDVNRILWTNENIKTQIIIFKSEDNRTIGGNYESFNLKQFYLIGRYHLSKEYNDFWSVHNDIDGHYLAQFNAGRKKLGIECLELLNSLHFLLPEINSIIIEGTYGSLNLPLKKSCVN
jgi:hypothetical protein